jgi:hypothetical protein
MRSAEYSALRIIIVFKTASSTIAKSKPGASFVAAAA